MIKRKTQSSERSSRLMAKAVDQNAVIFRNNLAHLTGHSPLLPPFLPAPTPFSFLLPFLSSFFSSFLSLSPFFPSFFPFLHFCLSPPPFLFLTSFFLSFHWTYNYWAPAVLCTKDRITRQTRVLPKWNLNSSRSKWVDEWADFKQRSFLWIKSWHRNE